MFGNLYITETASLKSGPENVFYCEQTHACGNQMEREFEVAEFLIIIALTRAKSGTSARDCPSTISDREHNYSYSGTQASQQNKGKVERSGRPTRVVSPPIRHGIPSGQPEVTRSI